MTVPLIVRIGALVLATTGFYAYVGQMVPQKEVQPPQETALEGDLTTADMVKVGREIMEGKGLCLTCHTIGKTGALRFPDLDGVDVRAKTRVPGLSDVEYLAQSMYEPDGLHRAGIHSGDAPDQQASDRPHRSGDPLRDRVPPDSWRHADGHAPDDSPLQQRRGRTGAGAGSAALRRRRELRPQPWHAPVEEDASDEDPGRPRRGRRVRAPSLPPGQSADVGRRLVGGDLRPPPIRIHCPDSRLRRLALHGNRLDRDPGVRVLQPGAPRRSLRARSSGS